MSYWSAVPCQCNGTILETYELFGKIIHTKQLPENCMAIPVIERIDMLGMKHLSA